jgi:hypothetical protein
MLHHLAESILRNIGLKGKALSTQDKLGIARSDRGDTLMRSLGETGVWRG